MHTDYWIQQVTTRVGAVTYWIQQSVSPKQVVEFTCVFNSEIDHLIKKSSVFHMTVEGQRLICIRSKLLHSNSNCIMPPTSVSIAKFMKDPWNAFVVGA